LKILHLGCENKEKKGKGGREKGEKGKGGREKRRRGKGERGKRRQRRKRKGGNPPDGYLKGTRRVKFGIFIFFCRNSRRELAKHLLISEM
jgi:hypothetical protein